MRLNTLLFSVIFVFSLTSFGQNKNIEFGLKAGLNYSSFIDNNEDISTITEYSGMIGFHIGAFISKSLGEKISLRPELLFSLQGGNSTIDLSGFNRITDSKEYFEANYKEYFIILPLMLEYSLNSRFAVGLGPQFAYLMTQKIEYKNIDAVYVDDIDDVPVNAETGVLYVEENEDVDKFEIGVNADFGVTLSENYKIGLRYSYGLIKRERIQSSVLQLSMYYRF